MQSSVPHQPSPFLFTTTARAEAHLILLFPLLPEYPPYTSLSPIESEITVLDTLQFAASDIFMASVSSARINTTANTCHLKAS